MAANAPAPAAPPGREWDDDELVLVSALEHWSYCPRQCGLIHLEATFDENLYTLRGSRLHRVVDEPGSATSRGVGSVRAMPIWSRRLGLTGRADAVEFRDGVPYPVEQKSGRTRRWTHEALQLCAQAICLEEMFGVPVPAGAIYSHASRERREIVFTPELRAAVAEATAAVRAMLASETLPPAVDDPRCPNCSLHDACLPGLVGHPARLRGLAGELFRPAET